MLDFTSYETAALAYQQLELLCTAYGRTAHKTVPCPPRRLGCYAAVWVSSGSGWLETGATSQRLPINSGSLFWLFPQVMHTYTPDVHGWTEQWVLFDGTMARSFERLGFLSPSQPCQQIVTPTVIEEIFARIQADYRRGGPLAGVMGGALVHQLVIVTHQLTTEIQAERDPIVQKIEQSRQWLDEHACEFCNLEELATACRMGYSTFRRHFKNRIGCSPKEYIVRARLRKAKELLAFTRQSIAEIAIRVGFPDPYYFSRLFHEKEGITPTLFRTQQRVPSSH